MEGVVQGAMVGLKERSLKFWTERAEYPPYPYTATRRKLEVDYLETRLDGIKRVVDVGCGDGALIRMLAAAHPGIEWYGLDIGSMWLYASQGDIVAEFQQRDVFADRFYPEADLTIASGVLNFAFTGAEAENFIENVRSPRLYVRAACSTGIDGILADGYSKDLDGDYVAVYRTVENVLKLLKRRFDVPAVFRIYPDSIESAFGTKQFVFEAVKR